MLNINDSTYGMKWYKFLIYFALFAFAVINISYGSCFLVGDIYEFTTNGEVTSDFMYDRYGKSLMIVDVAFGFLSIGFAVFSFVVRNNLAHFKYNAPKLLYVLLVGSYGSSLLYAFTISAITGTAINMSQIITPAIGGVIFFANYKYFTKRSHLFHADIQSNLEPSIHNYHAIYNDSFPPEQTVADRGNIITNKRKSQDKSHTYLIIVAIMLILSIVLNLVQHVQNINSAKTIASQATVIEKFEKKSVYFDIICKELSFGNIGYSANNFKSSESVIVVDKNEMDRKFILTANWTNGGTVSVDYSNSSASVSFDNDSWSTYTTMTVIPQREGVTTVTFSNDVDASTFKILIIVTD